MKRAKTLNLIGTGGSLRFVFPVSSQSRHSRRIIPAEPEIHLNAIEAWIPDEKNRPIKHMVDMEYVFDRFPYVHKLGYVSFSVTITKKAYEGTDFLDRSNPLPRESGAPLRLVDLGNRFYWLEESAKRQVGVEANFIEYRLIDVPISHDYMALFLWNFIPATGEPSDPDWVVRARALMDQVIDSMVWTPGAATPGP
jgi:hypothetical protein